MEYRKMDKNHYVIRIDKDEEVLECLTKIVKSEAITCASCVGLGAAKYVKVGLFDTLNKKYNSKEFSKPMEITSLVGNVSQKDGEAYLHFHINLCDESMNVFGGHLNLCVIGATCELVLTVIDGVVEREFNEEIGLNLYKFIK